MYDYRSRLCTMSDVLIMAFFEEAMLLCAEEWDKASLEAKEDKMLDEMSQPAYVNKNEDPAVKVIAETKVFDEINGNIADEASSEGVVADLNDDLEANEVKGSEVCKPMSVEVHTAPVSSKEIHLNNIFNNNFEEYQVEALITWGLPQPMSSGFLQFLGIHLINGELGFSSQSMIVNFNKEIYLALVKIHWLYIFVSLLGEPLLCTFDPGGDWSVSPLKLCSYCSNCLMGQFYFCSGGLLYRFCNPCGSKSIMVGIAHGGYLFGGLSCSELSYALVSSHMLLEIIMLETLHTRVYAKSYNWYGGVAFNKQDVHCIWICGGKPFSKHSMSNGLPAVDLVFYFTMKEKLKAFDIKFDGHASEVAFPIMIECIVLRNIETRSYLGLRIYSMTILVSNLPCAKFVLVFYLEMHLLEGLASWCFDYCGNHDRQVPEEGGDALMLSVFSAYVGKVLVKWKEATTKIYICYWDDHEYGTLKMVQDSKSGNILEKMYHFIIATSTSTIVMFLLWAGPTWFGEIVLGELLYILHGEKIHYVGSMETIWIRCLNLSVMFADANHYDKMLKEWNGMMMKLTVIAAMSAR